VSTTFNSKQAKRQQQTAGAGKSDACSGKLLLLPPIFSKKTPWISVRRLFAKIQP